MCDRSLAPMDHGLYEPASLTLMLATVDSVTSRKSGQFQQKMCRFFTLTLGNATQC